MSTKSCNFFSEDISSSVASVSSCKRIVSALFSVNEGQCGKYKNFEQEITEETEFEFEFSVLSVASCSEISLLPPVQVSFRDILLLLGLPAARFSPLRAAGLWLFGACRSQLPGYGMERVDDLRHFRIQRFSDGQDRLLPGLRQGPAGDTEGRDVSVHGLSSIAPPLLAQGRRPVNAAFLEGTGGMR